MYRPKYTMFPALLLIFISILPVTAQAIPAITCHCFTERSYQPERPAAADQYFLATAQNSFFAAVFGIDKKTVVIKKQQGVASDDLWTAYWIASRTGMNADDLLQGRSKSGSWGGALTSLKVSGQSLGTGFLRALDGKAGDRRLAEAVVDNFILGNNLLSSAELAALRQAGANNQELIISTLVASKSKQPARSIFQSVKTGSASWGEQLRRIGIDSNNMQREISGILHK